MGGLGNQLFQINIGCYLEYHGFKVVYIKNLIEDSFLTKSILGWKIHPNLLEKLFQNLTLLNFSCLIPLILSKLKIFSLYSYYFENTVPDLKRLPSHIFGYFQDIKFNEKIWFDKNIRLVNENLSLNYDCVVHLRFTDANNFLQNLEYYKKVLKIIKFKKLLICTDDKRYAHKFLLDNNCCHFEISKKSVIEDFYILSSAKEVVIAPSSFSWWATRLNHNLKVFWASDRTINEFGYPNIDNNATPNII